MKPRLWMGWGLSLAMCAAMAAGPAAQRTPAEASLLVTGTIDVDAAGQVTGYTLDQQEKLPEVVRSLMAQDIPGWRFTPVLRDGKAMPAHSDMSIRVVAHRGADDAYVVEVHGASFGNLLRPPAEDVRAEKMRAPDYPELAVHAGASGTAYVALKVGRDGRVLDAAIEQVNLKFVASDKAMDHVRRLFAQTALSQSKSWTFVPPTQGDAVDAPFWSVRVPVAYDLQGANDASYGKWDVYIPGPPWETENDDTAFSPDSLPAGGVYLAGSDLHLLNLKG